MRPYFLGSLGSATCQAIPPILSPVRTVTGFLLTIGVVLQAYFRSAKAALQLGQYALCVQLSKEGQALDSKAPEFASMIKVGAWDNNCLCSASAQRKLNTQ